MVYLLGAITPYKFGQTPNKLMFDLKASLNKPLTYKPHTGKSFNQLIRSVWQHEHFIVIVHISCSH